LTVHDDDGSDIVTASVTGVSVTGNSYDLNEAQLLAMFSVTPNPVLDDVASGALSWHFASDPANFDALSEGEPLELVYTVRLDDGLGGIAEHSVVVNIIGSNDAPVIVGAIVSANLTQDSPVQPENQQLGAIGTIDFADGDIANAHDITFQADPANALGGIFSIEQLADSTGTGAGQLQWHYELDPVIAKGLAGQAVETFNVLVDDGNGGVVSQAISITVTGINDTPVLSGNAALLPAGAEDSAYTLHAADLLQGWTDAEGDALAVVNLRADHGSVVNNNDGSWTFTPAADYNGAVTFHYAVSDGEDSTPATLGLTLAPVNDAPVLTGTPATLADGTENVPYTVTASDLLAGWSDADGDALSVSDLAVDHGSVTANGNGSWTFMPAANLNGAVAFSYTVSDGSLTATSSASLTLDAVNDAPVAAAVDLGHALEDSAGITITAAQLLGGARDIDGDTLQITALSLSDPSQGQLSANVDGGWTFVPAANLNGAVAFSYTVSDGHASASSSASLTLDAVNDAPMATAVDLGHANEDSTGVTITAAQLLAGASDADGDTLQITALSLSDPSQGQLSANVDGSWTFVPAANLNGAVGFSYTVSDGSLTATSSASLTLDAVNDAPVAAAVDLGHANEDSTGVSITAAQLLAGASDADGDTLQITALSLSDPSQGQLSANVDGSWTFVPAANLNGAVAFSYTVSDGSLTATSSASLTLDAVNDAPVAEVATADSDAAALSETDAPVAVNGTLTIHDADAHDVVTTTVTAVSVTGNAHGLDNVTLLAMLTVSPNPVLNGTQTQTTATLAWQFNSGMETFTALSEGEVLKLVYTLRATDAQNASAEHTLTLTLTGSSEAPDIRVETGDSDGAGFEEGDSALTANGTLTVEDLDTGDIISATVTTVTTSGGEALELNDTALRAMLTLSPDPVLDGNQAAPTAPLA